MRRFNSRPYILPGTGAGVAAKAAYFNAIPAIEKGFIDKKFLIFSYIVSSLRRRCP